MDLVTAVVVTVLAGGLAIIGTIAGQRMADRSARAREAASWDHADRGAAADRVRAALLRDLDETREVLIGNLTYLEQSVVIRMPDVEAPDNSRLTRYNINLVGDVEAVRAYDDLTRELAARLPLTVPDAVGVLVRKHLPRKSEIDPNLIFRTTKVRAIVLAALDQQEKRALRDEPLQVVTADELASIGGADAFLEVLRDRLGRPNPDAAPDA